MEGCVIAVRDMTESVRRESRSSERPHVNPLKTKTRLLYTNISPYRAVNTLTLCYTNQSVNVV